MNEKNAPGAPQRPDHIWRRLFGLLLVAILLAWAWEAYKEKPERLEPLLSFAGSLLSILVAGIVAWAAFGQFTIARRRHEAQTEADRLRHEAQTEADFQRRITESFLKAVEQLGSDKMPVRVGGIYSLERISKESPSDYWTVMETLTAFVRQASRERNDPKGLRAPGTPTDTEFLRADADYADLLASVVPSTPTDIAAVLAVLKRRSVENLAREKSEGWRLDLRLINLPKVDLIDAHLEGALLIGAHLEGARLHGAHLEGADLTGAHLQGAFLTGAFLQEATLHGAHLEKAFLNKAHLQGANLAGAFLQGTLLHGSYLEGARLIHAHLQGALLLRNTYLDGADLNKADLNGAFLYEVDLRGVQNLTQQQLDRARGDANTQLPDGMTRPVHWAAVQR